MVMIEMRDDMLELLEEAKRGNKKTKLALCELEDAIYDCYETSEEEHEYTDEPEETELQFKRVMRARHHGVRGMDDDTYYNTRVMNRRSAMRRRRDSMGRYM